MIAHAVNTKNPVGTELADQVLCLNCWVHADNQLLNGADRGYVLHFEPGQSPAVWAKWNLWVCDDSMLFIHNEIDRFSIGTTWPVQPDHALQRSAQSRAGQDLCPPSRATQRLIDR